MEEQIERRIFALQYNLERLKEAYLETTRDALLEVGLQYDIDYEANDWFEEKDIAYKELMKKRQYVMFTYLFNFTQCYYSIKEYLKKLSPKNYKRVESYFSDNEGELSPRKLLSLNLKHNPENDVKYDFKVVRKETVQSKNRIEFRN